MYKINKSINYELFLRYFFISLSLNYLLVSGNTTNEANTVISSNLTTFNVRSKRSPQFFYPNQNVQAYPGGGGRGGGGFQGGGVPNRNNNNFNQIFNNEQYYGYNNVLNSQPLGNNFNNYPNNGGFNNQNNQIIPNQNYVNNNNNNNDNGYGFGYGFGNLQFPNANFNRFQNNYNRLPFRRRRNKNRRRNFNGFNGFSGFRPNGWGTGVYGEKQKRISQIKFQEYMRRIYGDENYDENNDILSADDLNGRVVAAPGEFPHSAVIGIRKARGPKNIDWKCGGTLIDFYFVLTAAHCTDFGGEPPNWIKIGDVNLAIREDTVATQRFRIADIYRHPKYKNNYFYDDIALIRLIRPAVFTKHVRPARLWASEEIPYAKVFALGYGSTQFGKQPTNVLTFFNLTVISNEQCSKNFPKSSETPKGIIANQICAVDLEQHRDTCQGDSGGPLELIIPGRRHFKYFIIGVTSFGSACTGQDPGVYTKVFAYLDWIESIVWPINLEQQQQLQQQQEQLQRQQLLQQQQLIQQQQQYNYFLSKQ